MTEEQNNGGYYHPQQVKTGIVSIKQNGEMEAEEILSGGITMRDWFAGMALNGFLSDINMVEKAHKTFGQNKFALELALDAYVMADAMIKARDWVE